jgi:hypothetical protein
MRCCDPTNEDVGKKIQFVFCATGDGEKKGTFDFVLYFKYFIHALKLWWPTEKFLWFPNFLLSSCRPLETWNSPLGGHITHLENRCSRRLM